MVHQYEAVLVQVDTRRHCELCELFAVVLVVLSKVGKANNGIMLHPSCVKLEHSSYIDIFPISPAAPSTDPGRYITSTRLPNPGHGLPP